jgi:AhpD family alkylhydroperoxidase
VPAWRPPPRRAWAGGSAVEDGQVGFSDAAGIVDKVDRNDLRAGDRERHEQGRPAFRGVDDADGKVVTDSSLPAATQELVKIRASQINGCARCTDMHTKEAEHAEGTTSPAGGDNRA